MTTEVVPIERHVQSFTAAQVDLIKRTIARGATDDELALFIQQCKRTGLDPFSRQIHAVKRWNSASGREEMQIQTGIDGYRLIAERTGKYDGQDGPYWCGKDGKWVDVWLQDMPPAAAKVVIYRKDTAKPFTGVARYASYVQTKKDGAPTQFWQRMGDVMVAKTAEALALRKAFPQELSAIYTDEEMQEEDPSPAVAEPEPKLKQEPAKAAADPTTPPDVPKEVQEMWNLMVDLKSSFTVFAELKKSIIEITGSDVEYRNILMQHGWTSAQDIKGKARGKVRQVARELYEAMQRFKKSVLEPPFAASDDDLPPILQGKQGALIEQEPPYGPE